MIKVIALLAVLGAVRAKIPGIWLDNVPLTAKIIQGENANEGEFPYMMSLQRRSGHTCGGSIITSQWVLTAAHCCADDSMENLSVLVGTHLLNQGGIRHYINKIILHPNYEPNNRWKNDICLIHLSSKISFNSKVQKVTLPPQDWEVKSGDLLTFSGWGYTTPNGSGSVPNRLQKGVNFPVLARDECERKTDVPMIPAYLCCRRGSNGQGICDGDSGSPLVKNGVQVGIASWVFLPCGSRYPDVYARVPHFINWIKSTLGPDANEITFLELVSV